MTTTDKAFLESFYFIALQIGKTKKSSKIAESLIKPCMLAAAAEVMGVEAANQLQAVAVSNDTVKR